MEQALTGSPSKKEQLLPAGLGWASLGRASLGLPYVLSQINYTTGNKSGGFLWQEIWCCGSDMDAGMGQRH